MRPVGNPRWVNCSFDPETLEAMNKWPGRLVQQGTIVRYGTVTVTVNVNVESGRVEWKRNGFLHRDGDLPAVIEEDGSRRWYLDGNVHRVGGPAYHGGRGTRRWHQHGSFHRLDGPSSVNHSAVMPNIMHWHVKGWGTITSVRLDPPSMTYVL